MAEDEATATARYIANAVSTQLMLKLIVELLCTLTEDPDECRMSLRQQVLEMVRDVKLAEMPKEQEFLVRAFIRESVTNLVTNRT